ncbi:DUF1559 domain-containing protein [Schlesneria paludicola]|uniref:DUF1559 domain-containing protein n=1 Tax=Schlesneria paludicola TaxID=360056 RepID=UPI00029AADE6|nr:DUF1559 domain-containing protein [Schlesneria paludicola]
MKLSRSHNLRAGLTLTDVVIVIAILAVLAAFLLPNLRNTREAARRTQCKNNLKQFGLAYHNYHDTFSVLPAGYYLSVDGAYTGWGWGIHIAPYLDASNYYNGVNQYGGLQHEYNKPHMNPALSAYRCPSDELASRHVPHLAVVTSDVKDGVVIPATQDAANVFSRSNYFPVVGYLPMELGGIDRTDPGESQTNPGRLGNVGSLYSQTGRYCDQPNFGGAFGQNSGIPFEEIKDGLSNLFLLGERYVPTNVELGSVGHGTWLGVPDCTTPAGLAAALGDTSVKVNLGFKTRAETTGFGSSHTGGAHFLMGDGAVRFVSDNISITTYRDLSTIDDGREVGDF